MDKIIIEGGQRLEGEVTISGAKNAALPIMASTLLADGTSALENIPDLLDIRTIANLLRRLGAEVDLSAGRAEINSNSVENLVAPYELVKTMRASVLVLGPLLTRFGKAQVSLPGGCAIGARPINLHLKGLTAMGAEINLEHGYVQAEAPLGLQGADIFFDLPTVTGTENLLMAAVLANGTTILRNAAREPEVADLANALTAMGAKIEGIGTDVLTIEGVKSLKAISYGVMSDRIEAATFMAAAGITGGRITIKQAPVSALTAVENKLKQTGLKFDHPGQDTIVVTGPSRINSVDIKTEPYPGFPTDMQAQFMAMMCFASGLSVITETIFDNRFIHVSELERMGADIRLSGNTAIVEGVPALLGAPVMATDLRASASLVLAGLAAKGQTEVSRVYHIDRGYERIEEKLSGLGARIRRIKA
ncbi:MAG: UDP-N-acetylglucosamine 1-carboxyvinyltransferase [Deltaproteobacteria bacterium]|nr:UDP-N-acetylglucosamine 1-carboxyvinyltransferase [Deltaproteobacteria bacterium]MBW2051815.1 UDP-N-acetylglucosamine 1-carboxyvinyltransferase [Deltaproteobacteria bacterium]MBW2139689.1 UDP-N-acetylglucosamine 1-carboxyvinyltransferase [Deltaproteobacteria bacterium]MBW2322427.1 UDP-N-acetylglucosamine 1-carboxyvinyltransferase [Deltaproteobacteria bacterium]